jgi:hypothetical protein
MCKNWPLGSIEKPIAIFSLNGPDPIFDFQKICFSLHILMQSEKYIFENTF